LAVLTEKPVERYWRTIFYTDRFLAALDAELAKLKIADKTIFCVVGDHGEAFGEHSLHGHERIPFDDVVRVPFVLRAPYLVEPASKVMEPVGSVDLTPTLLTLLGFDAGSAGFDGVNALADIPEDRKVYFAGWLWQSSVGFVKGRHKFVYNPVSKKVFVYDLSADQDELVRLELPEQWGGEVAAEILAWRKYSLFQLDRVQADERVVFDRWLLWGWGGRTCSAKRCPPAIK
jgi:arylsulfatase A-like enzyme